MKSLSHLQLLFQTCEVSFRGNIMRHNGVFWENHFPFSLLYHFFEYFEIRIHKSCDRQTSMFLLTDAPNARVLWGYLPNQVEFLHCFMYTIKV